MKRNIRPVLDQIKKEVITETNRIRTNPKAYIPILERYLENFDDNILTRPDKNECIETQEGPKAYKEAIEFLKNQKPIYEIEFDEEGSKVAEEYAKILSNSGEEEQGQDESHIEERVEKYLDYDYSISENIDFGGSSGIEVMVNLLVDDGVEKRTHRENLFSHKFQYFGVSVASHPEYEFCTIIDYFGDILSYKNKEKDKIFQEKKSKKKPNSSKIGFSKTKNGLPNLSHKISPVYKKNNDEDNQETSSAKNSEQKTISEYEGYDEINNNENPFYDDPDAPEGCVKRKIKHYKKKFPQKTLITTVKSYILEDGSEETVTIDEVIFDD